MSLKPKKGMRLRAKWRTMNGYFRFGLIATLAVVLVISILSLGPDKDAGMPRWKAFWFASPNEIGDTIAGVAGTFAFLWIIVTVLIQGSELRLQRRELAMTRRELKAQREASEKMAIAQEAQVRALEAQAKHDEYAKVQRDETGAKESLDGHLNSLRSWLQNEFLVRDNWEYKMTRDPSGPRRFNFFKGKDAKKDFSSLPEADFFHQSNNRMIEIRDAIARCIADDRLISKPARSIFEHPIKAMKAIDDISKYLSTGQKQRLSAVGFESLRKTFDELVTRTKTEAMESIQP